MLHNAVYRSLKHISVHNKQGCSTWISLVKKHKGLRQISTVLGLISSGSIADFRQGKITELGREPCNVQVLLKSILVMQFSR